MARIDTYNFSKKRALVRVDFNVPLDNNTLEVMDDTRIKAAVPTINKILNDGGSVVLMSHCGRPKSGPENRFSLKHLVETIEQLVGVKVHFSEEIVTEKSFEKSSTLPMGEILLLENLRFDPREKAGNIDFSKALSKHGDVYVNDAFGTAHRAHASTSVIAEEFPEDKMFGYLIEKEVESVSTLMKSGDRPIAAIIGGAKVSSKINIINNLLEKIDILIIGGGMTYTFAKAQGGNIGDSVVEDGHLETARKILKTAAEKNIEVIIPVDSVIASSFSNEAETQVVATKNIPAGWMGLDVGPKTISDVHKALSKSKTILWNGPMGVFEMTNFVKGTYEAAKSIVSATQNGAFSLVGGGDSVAAINLFGLSKEVSHVSTGGGAMLEFLEGKELPGIKAIMS
ncbi:MAG: phosphoglycerate kinase [Crocinitomicaceae bacterium]|nr:phosphoglycerate kinase [Crocinitomicaceae bacterium]MBT6028767.1 phosphoglycerate kinase [Crocinitomicaceae bacterium]